MSKAFVIKVKENCYWLGGFYGENNYDDIAHAKVYHLRTQAEKQCKLINEFYNYNAQVVESTIVEGDLEQQLTKKDKQIEGIDYNLTYKQIQIDNLEKENKQMKEQLAEKDKEIEELKTRVSEKDKENFNLLEQNEELTYRIADVVGETTKLENIIREKDKEIEEYKTQIKEFCGTKLAKLIDKKEREIRKQVCDMARKKIVEATCYDTEEEIRNVIYDLNASTILGILDQIEQGE